MKLVLPMLALVPVPGAAAQAAWAVEELIKPKAVIPSHANEAATEGGDVIPGTRTQKFIELVESIPVHLPLSGQTMEFDGDGSCVKGC